MEAMQLAPVAPSPRYHSTVIFSMTLVVSRDVRVKSKIPAYTQGHRENGAYREEDLLTFALIDINHGPNREWHGDWVQPRRCIPILHQSEMAIGRHE